MNSIGVIFVGLVVVFSLAVLALVDVLWEDRD